MLMKQDVAEYYWSWMIAMRVHCIILFSYMFEISHMAKKKITRRHISSLSIHYFDGHLFLSLGYCE